MNAVRTALGRAATTLGAALLITGALPATFAHADAPGEYCRSNLDDYIDVWRGHGCFVSYGDKITVRDNMEDGLRVIVTWQTDYGRSDVCHNAKGFDTTVTCNYDMREDSRIRFEVCNRNGASGANLNCTTWTPWLSISTGKPA
ncbi:hypothetical protein ACFO1B_49655 [Dactylosporangium siamense]|uniref:Secreted protein n=1 Tax=Dactylosporangium siamense TaxID=685454 RepID=A0A919Q0L6_9ACTN|nr:hypothetical protein [Dactylosporangium siamense]GIG52023.1 hypothetical protein Dsi01nite_100640 [Dactylosporangium siamense]